MSAPIAPISAAPSSSQPAASASVKHFRWKPVVAVAVIVVAVILGLALTPVSHAFSFSVSSCGGLVSHYYSAGTTVTFHWNEPDGTAVGFGLAKGVYGNATLLYAAGGANGLFSFTSTGGTYTYVVPGGCGSSGFFSNTPPSADVSVGGHWAAPLI